MHALMRSAFFLRFAGGFALGAVALVGMQFDRVSTNLGLAKTEIARTA